MNYIKGFEYEKFIRDYLLQNHKIVYLWKDVNYSFKNNRHLCFNSDYDIL